MQVGDKRSWRRTFVCAQRQNRGAVATGSIWSRTQVSFHENLVQYGSLLKPDMLTIGRAELSTLS